MVILIRHGKSMWANRAKGQIDVGLSKTGKTQSTKTASYVAEEWPAIDKVISSGLRRCDFLAEKISDNLNKSVKINRDLQEWDLGYLAGRPKECIAEFLNKSGQISFPGGEKRSEFHQRVWEVFKKISAVNQKTAIVTHNGVIHEIIAHIFAGSEHYLGLVRALRPVPHCSATVYRPDKQRFTSIYDTQHLDST